jgi:hypothetical protein
MLLLIINNYYFIRYKRLCHSNIVNIKFYISNGSGFLRFYKTYVTIIKLIYFIGNVGGKK